MVNRVLLEACNTMVEEGLMVQIGSGFQYIGPIDLGKLAQVELSYGEAFERRFKERQKKELAAWKKFRDYVITY